MSLIIVHEMGHALIDVWKLPASGREEDAVDQLSTLMLINGPVDGKPVGIYALIYRSRGKDGTGVGANRPK